jgi:hypothetical protein
MVIESFLFVRKRNRTIKIGSALAWMISHIWLGLLTVPLVFLHTGFRVGGWFTIVLSLVFAAVIISGVYGLILQNTLPSRMWKEVPSETIFSQIDRIIGFMNRDARRLAAAAGCGDDLIEQFTEADEERAELQRAYIVVGRFRSSGVVEGKVLNTRVETPVLDNEDRKQLREFFLNRVDPFLMPNGMAASELADGRTSEKLFSAIAARVAENARPVVDALEQLADQRRQLHRQARLHRRLHSWLWIHLPLTVVLLMMLVQHIWTAILWW